MKRLQPDTRSNRDELCGILAPCNQISAEGKRLEKLRQLSRQQGHRLRQVQITTGWKKSDGGWMFVASESGELYLAVPNSSGYIFYDDQGQKIHVKLDQLRLNAFAIYPSLPETTGSVRELIQAIPSFIGWRDLLLLLLWSSMAGMVTATIPLATSVLFTDVIPRDDHLLFAVVIKVLIIFTVATTGFQLIRGITVLRVELKLGVNFEAAVWDRLLRLPAKFFRGFTTADLASRASAVSLIQAIFSSTVVSALLGFFFAFFNFIVMVVIAPSLALAALLCVLFSGGLIAIISWRTIRARKEQLDEDGAVSATAYGLLQALTKLRTAGALIRVHRRWQHDFNLWQQATYRLRCWQNLMFLINIAWPVMLSMVIFWLGHIVFDNPGVRNPHSGSFIAFYTALGTFSSAFFALLQAAIGALNVSPLLARLRPILQATPEQDDAGCTQIDLQGKISLQDVSYAYQPDQPLALSAINLEVEPGEFIAIAGPSGSGKTTLLRLLLGFDRPTSGQIYYDGEDIASLNVVSLRHQMGVVLQNGQLLPDTIFANIAGARPLSLEDVWAAAEAAAIADDIRQMPMEMYTYISESSRTISGGQRQRILIARALASGPALIIFDEATSALDNLSQRIVEESLAKLKITRIVIAHRLSTIRRADKIIVLQEGRLVEEGDYASLLSKKGLFFKMCENQ